VPLLLVTEVFPPRRGGSGRWFWELYRRLSGADVTVVAGPAAGSDEFDRSSPLRIERLENRPGTWGVLNPRSAAWQVSAARRIRRLIDSRRPVAIHCGKVLPEGVSALVARVPRALPIWCFAHGEELTLAETSRELRFLTRFVLRRAAKIIANSQNTRALLLERWRVPEDRVIVLTPGVDATRFVPAEPDLAVRRRLGWHGRRVILTVGALQKRKGQDMLIRALPSIRRQCPDVLYAIAGEGWERRYLEELAAEQSVSDAVQFVGTPDERELLLGYQQCDLFALPNRQVGWDFEGFGIALVEAQACARPVVTGTSGGTVETIIPNETGLSVPCETPEALAEACVALLDDAPRRAAMGARGRAWVLERFDWAVLARAASAAFLGRAED
jgi:phosphatidylinositol alpha-1,6-mannosyltransferase